MLLITTYLTTETISIPAGTLLYGIPYTLAVSITTLYNSSTQSTFTVDAISYPTTTLTNPSATILSWWQDDGSLLSYETCSCATPNSSPACTSRSATLDLSSGACLCPMANEYIDLSMFPQIQCRPKTSSRMSCSVAGSSSSYLMQVSFDGSFSAIPQNMDLIASMIQTSIVGGAYTIKDYKASVQHPNATITFAIPEKISPGAQIKITNLSQYNAFQFTPFLLDNLDPTCDLPPTNSTTSQNQKELTNIIQVAGAIAFAGTQAQIIASSVIPITQTFSTTALLLIGFLAEVDFYMFINVRFPDNFVTFCQGIQANLIPNVFAGIDTINNGANPSSIIGKFQFREISTVMLDNSNVNIAKELIALVIILVSTSLMYLFKPYAKVSDFFEKIKSVSMWNVFLSYWRFRRAAVE